MKFMKLALLGTAALAAVSVSARADDLADLKAQIEALKADVANLQAAPAVPAGYSLMTVGEAPAIVVPSLDVDKNFGATATNIGVLPTADMPASTNIQWSGYARAALVYSDTSWKYSAGLTALEGLAAATNSSALPEDSDDLDVYARGQLKVVGTTDTAVGEVGALVQLRGNYDGHGDAGVIMNEAWGWWKMTPELTLGGGYTGTLANIGYGYDGACNCYYTDNAAVALNPGDTTQMRLSYASGPMSFAVALEDATQTVTRTSPWSNSAAVRIAGDGLGAAGEIKYSGDSFSAEISGGWWDTSGDSLQQAAPAVLALVSSSDSYQVGIGASANLGDMLTLSAAAGMGQNALDQDYWKASILASANLSDAVHAEVAFGYADWDQGATNAALETAAYGGTTTAALAGIYYDPVSQLTIGLEGEWMRDTFTDMDVTYALSGAGEKATRTSLSVDLVTVFRF